MSFEINYSVQMSHDEFCIGQNFNVCWFIDFVKILFSRRVKLMLPRRDYCGEDNQWMLSEENRFQLNYGSVCRSITESNCSGNRCIGWRFLGILLSILTSLCLHGMCFFSQLCFSTLVTDGWIYFYVFSNNSQVILVFV